MKGLSITLGLMLLLGLNGEPAEAQFNYDRSIGGGPNPTAGAPNQRERNARRYQKGPKKRKLHRRRMQRRNGQAPNANRRMKARRRQQMKNGNIPNANQRKHRPGMRRRAGANGPNPNQRMRGPKQQNFAMPGGYVGAKNPKGPNGANPNGPRKPGFTGTNNDTGRFTGTSNDTGRLKKDPAQVHTGPFGVDY